MGNILTKDICTLVFCPSRKEHLDQEINHNAVEFALNICDINERGKRTPSFGMVPKNIFSQEQERQSRQRIGFSTNFYSESENDIEQDSFVSLDSRFSSSTLCQITEFSACLEEEESAKRGDGNISDGEAVEIGGVVAPTQIRRSGIIRSNLYRKSVHEKYSMVRGRQNAIHINPIDPPVRNSYLGKQFFLQNSEFDWERVTVEHWNCWNGTWQVRGEDGVSFPAAPIALKNVEDYEFLTKRRSFRLRSFNNKMEVSSKLVIV